MDHRLSPKDLSRAQFLAERLLLAAAVATLGVLFANPAAAASTTDVYTAQPVYLFGIPVDFILFGLTLLGVAIFHHKTLQVALTGLAVVTVYKLLFTGFRQGEGFSGLVLQMHHEWVILTNLFLLLMGFAILSRHFENSRIPDEMPRFLPDGWTGGLLLLIIVFVLSGFLDNIAAALIGGTIARHVFKGKVHIGYLAAIVAASNAGGAGSVVGDTTTTMMWIDGISPLRVVEAYVAAIAGFFVYSIPAAIQQHRHSPIVKDAPRGLHIDWTSLAIVAAILVTAITANVTANLKFPAVLDAFRSSASLSGSSSLSPRHCDVLTGRSCPRHSRARSFCSRSSPMLRSCRSNSYRLRPGKLRWARVPVVGVRQHPAHGIGSQARRLRLGLPRLLRWLRWFDDLVRFVRRRCDFQHVSGSKVGRAVAPRRLVHRSRLRTRLLRDARHSRMASRRAAQEARRSASTTCSSADGRLGIGRSSQGLMSAIGTKRT